MEPKQRIGDYEVIEQLGRGGMGSVYRVRSLISDRVEAMKVLLPDLVGRQDLAARFEREIKVLAALDHPNIAQLRTALKLDNQLVMIMEFVGGQSLAERVKRGPIPTSEALAYIDQMLNALTYAHAQGVIHRDIKPANMMLTPEGVVKLTDFGVARSQNYEALTATGTTTGSLAYMSPEQINGGAVDARSDLYSLGISLYEMVTGRRPFRANSDFAMMSAQLKEQPRPPIELRSDLNPQLNEIILRALAKNPTERFQSASEFRTALLGVRLRLGPRPSQGARLRSLRFRPEILLCRRPSHSRRKRGYILAGTWPPAARWLSSPWWRPGSISAGLPRNLEGRSLCRRLSMHRRTRRRRRHP